MPTFTSNKGYAQPTVGGDVNSWGGETNTNWGILDANLGGHTAPISTTTGANITLTAQQAQQMMIVLRGVPAGAIFVIFPALGGFWFVNTDYTSGAGSIQAQSAGGGSPVLMANAGSYLLYSDGTNMYLAAYHA